MMCSDGRKESTGPRRRSRFGPSAIVREGPPSEDAHLLSLFAQGADAVVPVQERRRSPRYPAVEHRAWLGWWSGPRQFLTVAAHLCDISQGGARLVTNDPPPAGQIIWLCLGLPEPAECVQAKVLEVTRSPEGDPIIRIAFGTPCPQNLYRAAVYGLAALRGDAPPGR